MPKCPGSRPVSNCAFQIANIYLLTWNDLSDNVNSAQSLLTFR